MKDIKYLKIPYKYLNNDKLNIFIYIFLSLLIWTQQILYPIIWGKALAYIIENDFKNFIIYLIIWSGIGIVSRGVLNVPRMKIYNNLEEKFINGVSQDLVFRIMDLPEKAFEKHGTGELVNRTGQDAYIILNSLYNLFRLSVNFILFLVVMYISFTVSYIITIEFLVLSVIVYISSNKYLPIIKEKRKTNNKKADENYRVISEMFYGLREIKALGVKKRIKKLISSKIEESNSISKEIVTKEEKFHRINGLANDFIQLMVLLTSGILYITKKITFNKFTMMHLYTWRITDAVESLSDFGVIYSKMMVSIKRIDEIINNRLFSSETFGKVSLKDSEGRIVFSKVCFKYNDDENLILNSLNLNIEPNKKIAIIGKSGQGKSTLFNLLLRYFDPIEGNIYIDNVDIKTISEESLRKNISIIRQNPTIFNMSILENLKLINQSLSLKEIKSACKKSYIHDYIESLPKKYDTLIGEGGINLSGGQKQRLAIARALLKGSKIILFDEATSALDNESQEYIKKTIDELVSTHTVIIVAHRLSTIIDSDIIHIIHGGQLETSGTHKELMNTSSLYRNLYNTESA